MTKSVSTGSVCSPGYICRHADSFPCSSTCQIQRLTTTTQQVCPHSILLEMRLLNGLTLLTYMHRLKMLWFLAWQVHWLALLIWLDVLLSVLTDDPLLPSANCAKREVSYKRLITLGNIYSGILRDPLANCPVCSDQLRRLISESTSAKAILMEELRHGC